MRICLECHRCECGAGPLKPASVRLAHTKMHEGQVPEVVQPVTPEPIDPRIATDTLLGIVYAHDHDGELRDSHAINDLIDYAQRLHELIRWAALPYLGAEPEWLTHDLYGHEMPANGRLIETWRGVVGTPSE